MKKLFKLSLLFLSVFVFAYSCKTQAGQAKTPPQDISGAWVLKSLNGQDVSLIFKGKTPTMNIDITENRVSGNGGCNNYIGGYIYEKGLFSVPNAAATMMACMDENQEPQFLKALSQPNQLLIEGEVLKLTSGGTVVVEFIRGIDTSALSGLWSLKSINGKDAASVFSAGVVPTIEFNTQENRLGGNGGCNRYNASYTLQGNSIKVGPVMSTRMACQDLKGETQFTDALTDTDKISLAGNQLTFEKEGKAILTFSKK